MLSLIVCLVALFKILSIILTRNTKRANFDKNPRSPCRITSNEGTDGRTEQTIKHWQIKEDTGVAENSTAPLWNTQQRNKESSEQSIEISTEQTIHRQTKEDTAVTRNIKLKEWKEKSWRTSGNK
uniref:Secreted protein n=1 Tax=Cacopsylla melanoneura TaxID=428564 RepID=A0A8D9ETX0_9HEMI